MEFEDNEDVQFLDEELDQQMPTEEPLHEEPPPEEIQANQATEDFEQEDDAWDDAAETVDDVEDHIDTHQVAEKMNHALQNRPSESRLEDIGVLKGKRGSMSDILAGVAVELEKNMTIDKLAHELEVRPSEQRLEEMNVIKGRRNSTLSNALVGTAVVLEKQITHDKLSHALEHRPSEKQLEACGLMKSKRGSVSDVLASTAVHLEKEMKADAVNASLRAKRSSDMSSLVPPPPPLAKRSSLSNVLAANARELEKQMNIDNVSAGLSRRSSSKDLLDRGVLKRPPSESNVLAATAITLEKAFASDRVSDTIAARVRNYIGNNSNSADGKSEVINTGSGLKERMSMYMAAASGNKSPEMGMDIKERMKVYHEAIKSSASPPRSPVNVAIDSPKVSQFAKIFSPDAESTTQSIPESKVSDSPHSGPSMKERLQAYQEAANASKTPPKAFAETLPLEPMSCETEQPNAEEPEEALDECSDDCCHSADVNKEFIQETVQNDVFTMEAKQEEVEEAW